MAHGHIVSLVQPGSIGEEMGIEPGDRLLEINGNEIADVFDYHYHADDDNIVLLIEKPDGEQWELEIEKDEEEGLGLEFGQSLMDEYRSCRNKCMFCFIDQMPGGMRDTLYFKDDDSRLSFLQGNYITLTNMSDHDAERIVKYHLEPINISFHTTNPELRCKMLHNRFAGDALKRVDILYRGGIEMNGQIVLCKGVNDKEELERSIRDLTAYLPFLRSVSVVPVGLTKFRKGLYPLEPFTKEDAKEMLAMIHNWQDKIYEEYGIHFIHAGDEWYILAEEAFPEEERYDGYLQLENGVGMLRLLIEEFREGLAAIKGDGRTREVSLATGKLAYPYVEQMLGKLKEKFPNIQVHLYAVRNDFFGEHITVSGLITGQDLTAQLKGQELGEVLLIPCNMLRADEDVFLDDFTVKQVENTLQVPVDIVKSSGQDLIDAILG
jgi:putative radical SAM enzyme (TIGR03279 family)